MGTIAQAQHYSRDRNLPTTKSGDKLNSDILKTLRRTPHLKRGKNETVRYKHCQDEGSRRQEVVGNRDWELVSPGEIHKCVIVRIQFCRSKLSQTVGLAELHYEPDIWTQNINRNVPFHVSPL